MDNRKEKFELDCSQPASTAKGEKVPKNKVSSKKGELGPLTNERNESIRVRPAGWTSTPLYSESTTRIWSGRRGRPEEDLGGEVANDTANNSLRALRRRRTQQGVRARGGLVRITGEVGEI